MNTRPAALVAAAVTPFAIAAVAAWSLGGAPARATDVPAAVVNEDEMLTTTAADGGEQVMFAGRQLVTDLTGDQHDGFDWQVVNAEDAEDMLARGDVHAVLTIPSDFSQRVLSLQGDAPAQAGITIETDAAHDGISTQLATEVGESLVSSFGDVVTSGFVSGVYGGFGAMAEQLGGAVDGAQQLGDGGDDLASGLGEVAGGIDQLADGAGASQDGAQQLAAGASGVADGAGRLASGLGTAHEGIGQLRDGATGLSDGVVQYTAGVDAFAGGVQQAAAQSGEALEGAQQAVAGVEQLQGAIDQSSSGAAALLAALRADPATSPQALEAAEQLAAGLARTAQADAAGPLAEGLAGLGGGMDQLAAGAAQLQAGSQPLRDGASQLAAGAAQLDREFGASVTGAQQLADGARQVADGTGELGAGLGQLESGAVQLAAGTRSAQTGATQLADGARELGDGLAEGVAAMPQLSEDELADLSDVVADPVGFDLTERGGASGEARVSALAVPIALWLGALAIALALLPRRRGAIAGTASDGRVLGTLLARSGWLVAAQAGLATVVVHAIGGVAWHLVGATLAVTVPFALGATLLHIALAALWGRMGTVASVLLLALQAVAAGALLPRTMLAEPFRTLGEWLPVTHASDALLTIASGSGAVGAEVVALVLFVLVAALAALLALGAARRRAVGARLAALAPQPA